MTCSSRLVTVTKSYFAHWKLLSAFRLSGSSVCSLWQLLYLLFWCTVALAHTGISWNMWHFKGTWMSSVGLFLIGWDSFLDGESFLIRGKERITDEDGSPRFKRWQQQETCEMMGLKGTGLFTYEESSFRLLIFNTRTVMVMPMSTPAASNKAMTLMTSPVAICGSGFSTRKTHKNIH